MIQQFGNSKNKSSTKDLLEVIVIDCGQGDCFLINTRDWHLLIDCGDFVETTWTKTKRVLNRYLFRTNKKLYCIVSHNHSDHYGGFIRFFNEFNISNRVIMMCRNDGFPISHSYRKFREILQKQKIPTSSKILLPEGADFRIYKGFEKNGNSHENNNSVIFSLTHLEYFILFTGDSIYPLNNYLTQTIQNEADKSSRIILKISHHGSRNGTSPDLIEALHPDLSIISVGSPNRYERRYPDSMPSIGVLRILGGPISRKKRRGYVITESNYNQYYYYRLKISQKLEIISYDLRNRVVEQITL